MKIGTICCRSLEAEIRQAAKSTDAVSCIEVMNWELHIRPDHLLAAVTVKIFTLQKKVDAVVLGYGRCQAMDRLPGDFRVPVKVSEIPGHLDRHGPR